MTDPVGCGCSMTLSNNETRQQINEALKISGRNVEKAAKKHR